MRDMSDTTIPKSRIPVAKSTATLRQRASQLSLRTPILRLTQPSTANLRSVASAVPGSAGRPALRRIPSTNFKENYFAPPPPIPAQHSRIERSKGLIKKKSQLLPSRRDGPGHMGNRDAARVPGKTQHPSRPAPPLPPVEAYRSVIEGQVLVLPTPEFEPITKLVPQRTVIGRRVQTPAPSLVPLSSVASSSAQRPTISKRAPTPSPLAPALLPTSTIHRTPHRVHNPGSQLRPSPSIPTHLGSSPWKGPRVSLDQIKDTEYSFTEDDSVEIPSNRVPRLEPDESATAGNCLSVSSISRTPSCGQIHQIVASAASLEAIQAKDKEIETLHKELSVERQMLGRIRREAADKEQDDRRTVEAERVEAARQAAGLRREMAMYKCEAVVRAAEEMQRDIDAARKVIRRLRETLRVS